MKRVMPPSTVSSYTTSASSSPLCGRAAEEFSTLIATAARSTSSPLGISSPVRGHTGGAVGLAEGSATGGGSGSSLHPASSRANATAAQRPRRLLLLNRERPL